MGDGWAKVIVFGVLLAVWAVIAAHESIFKKDDTVCSTCGRKLNQMTTCTDHSSVCCVCYQHMD